LKTIERPSSFVLPRALFDPFGDVLFFGGKYLNENLRNLGTVLRRPKRFEVKLKQNLTFMTKKKLAF